MADWKKTKHPGVRYRERAAKKHLGKPDRYFLIRYGREGKIVQESVGWASQGITAQFASNVRSEILRNIKLGSGPQSLEGMRRLEGDRRDAEKESREALARENLPFKALGERYLEWADGEWKQGCKAEISRYRHHIEPHIGDIPIKQISTITLERLKKELRAKKGPRGKKLSPKTIHHCLTLIRQMFNKAQSWGLYDGLNPVSETSRMDKRFLKIPDNARVRFLSREEAQILFGALKKSSQQLHDICFLSLYTGMRVGEIFNLLWRDIDLEHGHIVIKDPKSGDTRNAYITPPLQAMFLRLKEEAVGKNSMVFKDRKGRKLREVSNSFDRVVNKLKFNNGVTDRRDRVVPHTLRHTFASWMVMGGEPLATVKSLMGHKNISMTLRYSHLSPHHERQAAMRLVEGDSKKVLTLKKKEKN